MISTKLGEKKPISFVSWRVHREGQPGYSDGQVALSKRKGNCQYPLQTHEKVGQRKNKLKMQIFIVVSAQFMQKQMLQNYNETVMFAAVNNAQELNHFKDMFEF